MPGELTEITEVATALGMLCPDLATAVAKRPTELRNVPPLVWDRLIEAHGQEKYRTSFTKPEALRKASRKAFRQAVRRSA